VLRVSATFGHFFRKPTISRAVPELQKEGSNGSLRGKLKRAKWNDALMYVKPVPFKSAVPGQVLSDVLKCNPPVPKLHLRRCAS